MFKVHKSRIVDDLQKKIRLIYRIDFIPALISSTFLSMSSHILQDEGKWTKGKNLIEQYPRNLN